MPAELASTVQALRALIDETRRCDAPDDALVRARELIDDAAALLRPYRYDGQPMQSTESLKYFEPFASYGDSKRRTLRSRGGALPEWLRPVVTLEDNDWILIDLRQLPMR